MPEMAPGQTEMQQLQAAGFTPSEVDQWRVDTQRDLETAGFSEKEVNGYFGKATADFSGFKDSFEENIRNKKAAKSETETPGDGGVQAPEIKEAETFAEAIEAGFDMSVSGLMMDPPDVVLKQNAPMYMRMASQISTLAGDVPAMVAGGLAGFVAGGAAGSAVPVVGNVAGATVGTGAGAFALPEGIRTALMEKYEKGEVESFSDFWERASAVAISSLKGGIIGGATVGIGGAVAKVVGKTALPAVAKTSSVLASEVLTMTTVGAALEGEVPEPQHILDAAILVGALRGTGIAVKKISNIYAKTGVKPEVIAEKVQTDAHLKQQVLASNVELPKGAVTIAGEFGASPIPPVKPPSFFNTVKALPERQSKIELSPEVSTIMSKVGERAQTKDGKKFTAGDAYTAFVDKLDPINSATKILNENKVSLPADKNPYILARTTVDYKAKAKHFFENGTLEYGSLKLKGPSLKSTLEKVESPEILEAYMISKRVIEKHKQGKATGFDIAAADQVIKQHGAKYEAAAKRVTEFSNQVLDYVAEAGVLSKDQAARMKALNKDYVPFKRIIEDTGKVGAKKGGGKTGSLKAFKGSERDIQSPINSIIENTVELVRMAEVNRPKQALIKLAENTPGQELIKKVKAPMAAVEVPKEQVAKQLGISIEQAEAVTTFRALNRELAPNQFAVFKDGKRQVYETTPDVAAALQRLGGDQVATNMFFKIANGITTVKKFGITFTPDFIMRNLFRDTLTASTFTKGKGVTPFDVASAMGDLVKKNPTYYEWLKSGGANGAFIDMGERYIKNDIWKLQKETNFMNSARNLVEKPIDAMRVAAELSEQSLRLAEFKKVRKAGGSLTEGGFASREITIDFQRVGAKMAALNSITAFMNVSIQGLDRTVRAVKSDPKGVTAKATAYITVPSVLLWWANHDDPRYQEIPRWEKDLFWIIPTDDWQEVSPEEAAGMPDYMVRNEGGKLQVNKGSIYRLPKPQELGIAFGSMPERVLEAFFTDNPGAFKDFEDTVGSLVTPSFVPDAVSPAIEQYMNKSFFTGRDIIPHHLKEVLPEYQFVQYTSEVAKTLGKFVATVDKQSDFASPMVIENYIRSWGGSLGQYAVQVADKALQATGVAPDLVEPTATLSDIPFVKAFAVRFPRSGSRSVQDFYDNYDKSNKIFKTIRLLAKEGDFDNLEKEMKLGMEQGNLVKLDGIKDALATQSKFIRLVHKNPDMTPDEKRQMIDGAYLMMTEIAKQGNLLMEEVKNSLGEK